MASPLRVCRDVSLDVCTGLVGHRDLHRTHAFAGRNLYEVNPGLECRDIEFSGFCINTAAGVNRLSYKIHDINTGDGVIALDIHDLRGRVRVNHDLAIGQFIDTNMREIDSNCIG